jgi:hypothetical protein
LASCGLSDRARELGLGVRRFAPPSIGLHAGEEQPVIARQTQAAHIGATPQVDQPRPANQEFLPKSL